MGGSKKALVVNDKNYPEMDTVFDPSHSLVDPLNDDLYWFKVFKNFVHDY